MVWTGLVVGALLGASFWGLGGAISLGFLGWLVGIILKSTRQPAQKPAAPDSSLHALSERVAALEARLARVERATVGDSDFVVTRVEDPSAVPSSPQAIEPSRVAAPAASAEPETRAAPAVVKPAPAKIPAQPNFIVAWFTGGNTIVRAGLVILFVGLAFLIKYGVEHQMVPVELRVAAVAAAGLALLVLGWRLRSRRAGYALSLQGAGVAILYLTIFGALRLYGLLPAGAAFALLAAIAVLSAFLAIAQDSLVLAAFGAAGGFLAPVLASTGGGSHVMLFSYFLLLNAGIVAIAWFKAWRVLNLIGFVFTFAIGLAWGLRSYRPEDFPTTEPFLAAFFLVYVAIAILFARKQAAAHRNYVDATLVFGNPIAAFGLQAGLMRGSEFGLAYSSLAAAALYLGLAAFLGRAGRERWTLLAESFLALGVVFASLAIPLALDARWTSAAWALEGAAVLWIGVRQRRKLARAFGTLLEIGAGVAFLNAYPRLPEGPPLADAVFVGAMLLALAGLWSHRVVSRAGERVTREETIVAPAYFLWGIAWWLFAGAHEIHDFLLQPYRVNALAAFVAATALAFSLVAARWDWRAARWPGLALAPALFALAIASYLTQAHPLAHLGWIAWPFALAAHFFLLRRDESGAPGAWLQMLHALGVIVLALLGAIELEWLAADFTAAGTAWSLAARIVLPAVLILAISSRHADTRWPVASHAKAYRLGAVIPLVAAIALWSLHINLAHGGRSDPLPYWPLLNAIDLAHVLAAIAIASAWLALRRSTLVTPAALRAPLVVAIAGAIVFVWLNAILLRTLHHWMGIPYQSHALWRSVEVQAALSVFWAFLALASMVFATRSRRRVLWMVGAGLMAVVVAKLVLVDLSRLGGIERIVSFIGVGVLMLVIGYFSPVPPRNPETSK